MTKDKILDQIKSEKIVAIIRLDDSSDIDAISDAIIAGGVNVLEVTIGTPDVFKSIEKIAKKASVVVGVGSVVSEEQVSQAVDSGAEFIVTPATKQVLIHASHKFEKPIFSGAYTPTEILQAYEWGADVVKLFPAAIMGIPYFTAVRAPMPYVPLMPTGGVTVENAASWIDAGAECLGVGSTLVNKALIAQRDFKTISEIAQQLKSAIAINK